MSGVRLQVDNDLFAGGQRDRDYTGGFGLTFSAPMRAIAIYRSIRCSRRSTDSLADRGSQHASRSTTRVGRVHTARCAE